MTRDGKAVTERFGEGDHDRAGLRVRIGADNGDAAVVGARLEVPGALRGDKAFIGLPAASVDVFPVDVSVDAGGILVRRADDGGGLVHQIVADLRLRRAGADHIVERIAAERNDVDAP